MVKFRSAISHQELFLLTYVSEAVADDIVHVEIALLGIIWDCRHSWGVERGEKVERANRGDLRVDAVTAR